MHPSITAREKNFDGVHILSRVLSSNYLLKHVTAKIGRASCRETCPRAGRRVWHVFESRQWCECVFEL